MIIVGIDPGLNGAIAAIEDDPRVPPCLFDIPTIKRGKTGNKREVNFYELHRIISINAATRVVVGLENIQAMPGQGVTSMFSMGHTFGGIKGVVAALGYEMHLTTPQSWKKYYRLGKDKEQARALAIQLYPDVADQLKRKKDADRAEALLIARYAKEVLIK